MSARVCSTIAALLAVTGCRTAAAPEPAPAVVTTPATTPAPLVARAIALPGAGNEVFLDYIVYDRERRRVWVPAGGSGKVDVIDAVTDALTPIAGFATAEQERRGRKRMVGPSAVTVGDGVVYVGDRADSTVCAVDAATLERGGCAVLPSMPDGVAYVAARKEVWVTAPGDRSLILVDVSAPRAPRVAGAMKVDGEPEGYAVDGERFFTNLEDKDRTLVIDTASRAVVKTWSPGCGEDGPRGVAYAADAKLLLVACTDHIVVLDAGGRQVGRLDTGAGVDNLDYVAGIRRVYAAAGRAGRMVVAELSPDGKLTQRGAVATAEGARNVVATETGKAYVIDPRHGGVLVVAPRR
jgi:DNA-binding beta-propeller fold protein YncE